jgi:hypothetical protein
LFDSGHSVNLPPGLVPGVERGEGMSVRVDTILDCRFLQK